MPSSESQIFFLSPARCSGPRASLLLRAQANFELAVQLRTPRGAAIGEVFSFLSGLYFRGKHAYAERFGIPPARSKLRRAYVLTSSRGLLPLDTLVTRDDLLAMGEVPIDVDEPRYRSAIERDLNEILSRCNKRCRFVLLGSIATKKYVDVLVPPLGERLLFPSEFVGRGDMSRGGLMLRCVDEERELTYVPIAGATRHGTRPPKLAPRAGVRTREQARG